MTIAPSPNLDGNRPLGQVLVDAGVVTRQQLADALVQQDKNGGRVGTHLVLMGATSRMTLYQAVAGQCGFDFVNLIDNPPDADLMSRVDPKDTMVRDWIPYALDQDTLVIATTEPPNRRMIMQAREEFGVEHVDIVITTDWDLDQAITRFCRTRLLFNAAEALYTKDPAKSAKGKPVTWQRLSAYLVMATLIGGFIFKPSWTIVALLIFLNLFFFAAVVFKIVTTAVGLVVRREHRITERSMQEAGEWALDTMDDRDLPMYTILVPVFKEANVINMVLEHVEELDWPKSKLQVLILTEEVDHETIEACKAANPPEFVRLVVVPKGDPQTKPRACNFGLMFAVGEYLVIFDAEDRPDPDQLRRAHAAFLADSLDPDQSRPLACVQASLNYFNWQDNLLTRMFTLEYSSWFDGMLHGMEFFRLPIPLGGTSNHFRTDRLRELGGWDPYNVTEDADLGMRASAAGYRVGTIDSTTWEEACSHIPAWIRQRTRWIKGYMVTALVDARYPVKFIRSAGWTSMFTLIGLIIGTPLMFLAYPIVWGITIIVYIGFETFAFTLPPAVGAFAVFNAIFGNVSVMILSMITGAVRHGWRISGYSLLNPIYWFLHAFASWRALFQVFFTPHQWEKTPHGLTHGRAEQAQVT
ncbi:MAG: glycosyltransferase [Actinomycetota bacterium]|nr:glycosyltransferase [Actinomycetota bacterium]